MGGPEFSAHLPSLLLSNFVLRQTASGGYPAQTAGCATSADTSGTNPYTICFSDPSNNSTLTGDVSITATINLPSTVSRVQQMVFYLDGSYLLTDFQTPYTFILPTSKWVDGNHALSVEARLRNGFTTQRANLSVNFKNGITVPPVNNNQFQPSTGTKPINGAPFIVAAAGDGAGGENNAKKVVNLITSLSPNLFLYLGDVYEQGSAAEFYNWYGQATNFGQLRSITNPTVGNHEYLTNGASGYFDYWNNIPPYYSYDAGGWHFISLDANSTFVPTDPQSAQYQWLQQDLAAHSQACTIVYYHQPLFNIGAEGSDSAMTDIWKLMAQYGVSIVLNGHDHDYQRWVPLDGNGQPSPNGITEFVAGGGGHGIQTFKSTDSRVAFSIDTDPIAFGVLLLQLNQNSVNFSYRSINGSVLDSGSIPCGKHSAQSAQISATVTAIPSSLTFVPVADAYVNADNPNSNYGQSRSLRVDSSPVVNSYLRFNVQGLSGKPILRARLLIYANSAATRGITVQSVVDNTWVESTINYNNAPAMRNILVNSGYVAAGSWVTLDVTPYITGEGTFSFGISTSGSTEINLASRESGADSPQLVVDLQQ
ncbi:MAG TPA: DNRLRE domain-containing protein [Anaerolineales bacterium]